MLPTTEGPTEALVRLTNMGTGAAALFYTEQTKRRITDFYFVNRTAGDLTVTVHIVPPGGSADNNNIFLGAFGVFANDTRAVSGLRYALEPGFTLWAFASGAGVNWAVMGMVNR